MSSGASPPDPEVAPIARRRQFSGSEKRRLLAEADRCKEAGTLGAFLRRERIYSSMLASWRKQLGAADRVALAPKRRAEARPLGPADRAAQPRERPVTPQARARGADHRRPKKLCVALGLPTSNDRTEEE